MAKKRGGNSEEALNRALRFLGYCPRSEPEVRAKLGQLGFSDDVVTATVERLRSLKLLDDERFARSWAQGRAENRGYGPLRIERELGRRGIRRDLIREIVRELFGGQGGKEQARTLLQKRFAGKNLSDPKILRRAISYLQRRGYRDAVIGEILRTPTED